MPSSTPSEPSRTEEGTRPTSYSYKASLIGSAHAFELMDAGLSWQIAGRSGVWPYAEIAQIRLSYRPVSMQARRFRADLEKSDGGRISVLSTTWQTAALMVPQDDGYRTFIVELHRRMKQVGSKAVLMGGIGPKSYAGALILATLVAVAIAGLMIRALAISEFSGALFLVGFVALFAWQIGGFVNRNRPRAYSFDHLPETLLP